jgi:putative ABC transport system substrate-binding protein
MKRLSRRAFVGGAGASVLGFATFTGCGLIPAASTSAPRIPRIGALSPDPSIATPVEWTGFRDGLAHAGWIEGRTITIEWRSADGDVDRLSRLAAELFALPVDLIATLSTPATVAAKQATSTVPIVFCGIGDPVARGFVQSLARPGGNLTGTTQSVGQAFWSKRLSLLKELLPALSRVAFMQDQTGVRSTQALLDLPGTQLEELRTAAPQLNLEINLLDVPSEADLEPAFTAARNWQAGALLVGGNIHELDQPIMRLAARERLPALYSFSSQVEAGGLLSYGPNVGELFRRAAAYHVDKILRGSNPADLPVEQPTIFELAVNQTTAKTLGLTLPPAFAAQVTEWIQ